VGDKTGIQWTDATWNPVTGCSKVSAGCKHCYAERVFPRVYGRDTIVKEGGKLRAPRRFTDVVCHEDRLGQPIRWRKPRRVFVNSMSDLFHEDVPDSFILQVFSVMAGASHHQFQVLTKRPERALAWFERLGQALQETLETEVAPKRWPLPNVWMGVSVEDQATADERIPLLLEIPSALRFISAEPLLGEVDLRMLTQNSNCPECGFGVSVDEDGCCSSCGHDSMVYIDWVIVGGESGPKARPMDPEWAGAIVDQCKEAGVPVFVKQLGGWPDKRGNPEDWALDLRVREWPIYEK